MCRRNPERTDERETTCTTDPGDGGMTDEEEQTPETGESVSGGESDAEVAQKAKYALDKGLKVIACCGEPQENREAGTTNDFVFPQIKAYADAFSKEDWKNVVIACKFQSFVLYIIHVLMDIHPFANFIYLFQYNSPSFVASNFYRF